MWLAFLFFVAAFNSFHRQKFVTCVALALIILGYLYPGVYFQFVIWDYWFCCGFRDLRACS